MKRICSIIEHEYSLPFEKILHARYVLLILHEVRRILKRLPNVNIVSTYQSTSVTVVGDLHGNLSDLMLIFHKVNRIHSFFIRNVHFLF